MTITLPFRQLLFLAIFLGFTATGNSQSNDYLYLDGTVWNPLFTDFLTPDDPNTFQHVELTGTDVVLMYDRDANNNAGDWSYPEAWIFDLVYSDSIRSALRVSKEDFGQEMAEELAGKWGKTMGLLPAVLREGLDSINILQGEGAFGGNGFLHSIEIPIGSNTEWLESSGSMEEILVHEATHASLDYLYTEGYVEARDMDPLYISAYSAENPDREDISETYLVYLGLKYRENRISVEEAERIRAAIGHRLSFFDGLDLDEYPFDFSDDTSPVRPGSGSRPIALSPSPNPVSSGEVRIARPPAFGGAVDLRLTDLNGRLLVNRRHLLDQTLSVNVASLPAGVYLLQLTDGQLRGVARVIVQ